jgi:uncharacterized protein YdcH (DUF465 family)
MYVEHHDLHHEFPQFAELINQLRASDPRFAKMFHDYNALTNDVEDLEVKDLPVEDLTFEELKKRRVKLKDELYAYLVAKHK